MIKIAGREFRTLAQPIYVDGKHVREVWANGDLVYPEKGICNTIKIRGHIVVGRSYNRPERNISRYESWSDGEIVKVGGYVDSFSVTASFAAVLRYGGDTGFSQEGTRTIPLCGDSFTSENVPADGEGYYWLPYTLFTPGWSTAERFYQINISPICMPLSPLDGSPVPTVSTLNIERENETTLNGLKILFRIDMAPIPLAGEYDYTDYSPFDYYHYDQITPIYNAMFSACDWNGHLIQSEGTSTVEVTSPWNSNASMTLKLGSQSVGTATWSKTFPSRLSVSFSNLMDRAILKSNHLDFTEARIVASVENFLNIPVTDVLYIGSDTDAPEWALDVTEDDLVW